MTTPIVNLRRLLVLLWSRRRTLGVCMLLAIIVSAVMALRARIEYESNAVLAQVRDDNSQLSGALSSVVGQLGGLVGGAGALGGSATSVEESVAVLRSRDFALRFMGEHDVLRFLFPEEWDAVAGKWKRSPPTGADSWGNRLAHLLSSQPMPPPLVLPPGPSPDLAVQRFERIRVVDIDRRTNFVKLAVRGPSPQVAHDWASAMIEELNESLRQRALEDSRRAIALLVKKVDAEGTQSMHTIASALLEQQLRREVGAESRREYALRVLDPPSLPDQRAAPRRSRMVLIGAGLGLLLGAAFVIAQTAWRQRRRAPAHRP